MRSRLRTALATLWSEPRAADPPARGRWDYLLLTVLLVLGPIGAVFEPDVTWRPVALPLGLTLAFTVLWRRTHALLMVVVAFGVQSAFDIVSYTVADGTTLVGASMLVGVVLIYALFRWASGRELTAGMAIVLAGHIATELLDSTVAALDAFIGSTIWLFPAALGLAMRYRARLHERRVVDARLHERHVIARELHDTVAHHVSAIAVQAQAGQAVARARPEAAAAILATIEDAASRTLDEMRQMVSVLREDDAVAELAPQSGLANIVSLADQPGRPEVDVELSGDLEGLSPSLLAGLYRLTQESITNARRHARHATRVSVKLSGSDDQVHLVVADDGDSPTGAPSQSGFGLVGMAERATLLGGTFEARPGRDRGWVVDAVLPRTGASS